MYPSLVPREGFFDIGNFPKTCKKIAYCETHQENIALVLDVHYENVNIEKGVENHENIALVRHADVEEIEENVDVEKLYRVH